MVLGVEDSGDLWAYAALRSKLPPARYQLSPQAEPNAAALGWLLGECLWLGSSHLYDGLMRYGDRPAGGRTFGLGCGTQRNLNLLLGSSQGLTLIFPLQLSEDVGPGDPVLEMELSSVT